MRDYQKNKVYSWEQKVIAPRGIQNILFANAQIFVDGVWLSNGWLYPPTVELIGKQARITAAKGNRTQIWIHDPMADWIILHELAHSLTTTFEGEGGARHGPDFVGIYIKLLEKVLNISATMLMYTLKEKNIDFNLGAIPWMTK